MRDKNEVRILDVDEMVKWEQCSCGTQSESS